jgi:hypothetical protein
MRTHRMVVLGVIFGVLLITLGCNPKVGLIYVNTSPEKAAVLINDVPIGETPTKFEFDMLKPVTMKILKEGYKPREEKIDVDWVKAEYHQGHYVPGEYVVFGQKQKAFEVRTIRELNKME